MSKDTCSIYKGLPVPLEPVMFVSEQIALLPVKPAACAKFALWEWFSNLSAHSNHPKSLTKLQMHLSTSRDDSVGLGL